MSPAGDVFAFGATIGCTLSGQSPEYITERAARRQIEADGRSSHEIAMAIASQFSIDARSHEVTMPVYLLQFCCSPHAASRPAISSLAGALGDLGDSQIDCMTCADSC